MSTHNKNGREVVVGDALAGIGLAVLATKPQAVGLAVVLIALWAVSRRRWIVATSMAASLLALLIIPVTFYPSSLGDWLGVVFGKGQAASQAHVSASVWGLSYQWLGEQAPWAAVAAILTIAGVLLLMPRWWVDLRDKASPVPASLAITLCINSVISPYMLGYEHVVLLLPAVALLARAGLPGPKQEQHVSGSKWWRMGIYSWMVLLPLIIVVIQSVVDKEYPVVIQSATMLIICWFAGIGWKPADRAVTQPSMA
jgi:hypothetical protein